MSGTNRTPYKLKTKIDMVEPICNKNAVSADILTGIKIFRMIPARNLLLKDVDHPKIRYMKPLRLQKMASTWRSNHSDGTSIFDRLQSAKDSRG